MKKAKEAVERYQKQQIPNVYEEISVCDKNNTMEIKKYKLCYVDDKVAYFTNKDLSEQWGDDWDDAPYEHNAGEPYSDNEDQIIKVMFDSNLIEPRYEYHNSPFSVDDINNGAIAWLRSRNYEDNKVFISAKTTIKEFIEKVEASGGEVFIPKKITQWI